MATKAETRRFIFRGNAMPLGGRIIRTGVQRVSKLLPSPPTSALNITGGSSRATSSGAIWQDVFIWGPTLAESTGEMLPNGHAVTTVTASVAGVSAKNEPISFEVDELKVTLISDHPETGQPSITPKEIQFHGEKGMYLAGKPITVIHDDDLKAFPTFATFEKEYRNCEKFFKKYQACLTRPLKSAKAIFGEKLPLIAGGYVSASIVRGIIYNGKKISGNVLSLDGFGSIYFGEVLMNAYNRRLTLVRLEMGSSLGAEMSYAEVDPNGTWGI